MIEHLGSAVKVDGVEHQIGHLAPFFYEYAGAGIDGATLRIRVVFSCHVFSEGCERGTAGHFADHNKSQRIFCPARHAYSIGLPMKVRTLLDTNALSWTMKDHNGFANLVALTEPGQPLVAGEHHVLLFYYYPSNADHFDVEMNILTCHYRPVNPKNHKRDKLKSLARACHIQKIKVPKN